MIFFNMDILNNFVQVLAFGHNNYLVMLCVYYFILFYFYFLFDMFHF